MVYGKWILNYQMTVPGLECLVVSCLVAVLVNVSQFMCLGRFTALTFQVRRDCAPWGSGAWSGRAPLLAGATAAASGRGEG